MSKVNDDDVDLSKAEIFADSSRGRYIPQYFAETVNRKFVTGVGEDDYKVLEAGPDHEHYDDAWIGVLDNASITNPKGGKYHLYQDGDLWIVPDDQPEATPATMVILGMPFKKMEGDDFDGFAGADEGSYMFCTDKAVLIFNPATGELAEIPSDGDISQFQQRNWKMGDTI